MYTLFRPEGPPRLPLADVDRSSLRETVRREGLVLIHAARPSHEMLRELLGAMVDDDEPELHLREWEIVERAEVIKPRQELKKSQEWHLDESWTETPANFATLMCFNAPESGGATEFMDLRVVLAGIRPDALAAIHDTEQCHSLRRGLHRMGKNYTNRLAFAPDEHPPTWHPLVRRQPGTDQAVLFANPLTTNGWRHRSSRQPMPEVAAIVREALAAARPYAHRWRTGDIVIFDNSLMLHRRSRDRVVGSRRMVQVDMARTPVEAVHTTNHAEGGAS
jgi:alpha-ketoglutarate-dependent taurine dioxygenase